MYEKYVICVFVALCEGLGGWNLVKIKIWSTLLQESIVPAIVSLDNKSSHISTSLIPEQFFQSKQMMKFCSDLSIKCLFIHQTDTHTHLQKTLVLEFHINHSHSPGYTHWLRPDSTGKV